VDPPRDGLHKDIIKFLKNLKGQVDFDLLYISCNPVTLARDVQLLLESGKFNLKILQPVDMFPHTHHIENIAFLN
jgi:23S rRNA (uracil1939-C5)-methyltransferase